MAALGRGGGVAKVDPVGNRCDEGGLGHRYQLGVGAEPPLGIAEDTVAGARTGSPGGRPARRRRRTRYPTPGPSVHAIRSWRARQKGYARRYAQSVRLTVVACTRTSRSSGATSGSGASSTTRTTSGGPYRVLTAARISATYSRPGRVSEETPGWPFPGPVRRHTVGGMTQGREETAMKALQYTRIGSPPEVVEVPTPEPSGGEVLLRVLAAGACHSDEFIMGLPEQAYVYGLPLTLGHEGVGVVEAVGPAVTGIQVGDEVAVYGPWGCGRCHTCATGAEQYCEVAVDREIRPPGLGAPGSMAEFMLVDDARHLVPLRGLAPTQAAPLTDAGLTPYHAIKPSLAQARARLDRRRHRRRRAGSPGDPDAACPVLVPGHRARPARQARLRARDGSAPRRGRPTRARRPRSRSSPRGAVRPRSSTSWACARPRRFAADGRRPRRHRGRRRG